MDKDALRTRLRVSMRGLPPLERAMQEELVNGMLLEAAGNADVLLAYKAKAPELSVVSFTNAAFRDGRTVVMPRVAGEGLELRKVGSWDDLEPGAFGIEEPRLHCPVVGASEISFAVIPGVGFTKDGQRLGQGGGFYDRTLPALHCPTWGAAFDCQMVDALPVESHDVSVGHVAWAGSLFA